jgi:hypothetical protein
MLLLCGFRQFVLDVCRYVDFTAHFENLTSQRLARLTPFRVTPPSVYVSDWRDFIDLLNKQEDVIAHFRSHED